MAKLLIYYSVSGNGDAVASRLAEQGFDVRKVKSELKLGKSLFSQIMRGGFSAGIGQKPKLIGYDADVSAYEEICIGSPIWNARLASPVNTVLRDTDLNGKKLSFVLYSGSGFGKKADEKLKEAYPEATIIHLKQPKDNPAELDKLVF
ncbi:MAG: hypothetical protein J5794_05220 [Lachnospiraceae bacterium]|nr:hypothetical protein [Lachnospiraceae bacterium]